MQVFSKDGKKQNRTLEINGFVKPSGTICASVKNDKDETYFVQVCANGTTCEHMINGKREECPGHQFTGHCYHVDAVKVASLPTYEEVTVVTLAEAMADADMQVRLNEQQAKFDAARNPYDVLATTKQVSREQYVAMFNPCGL